VRLYSFGPEDFPAIEAASKRADLKGPAGETLKKVVETVRPLVGRRTRTARTAGSAWQWAQRTALASYDSVGKRNPKWDDAARGAIAKWYEPDVAQLDQYGAIDKAVQLGCDDPLISAFKAHLEKQMRLADAMMAQKNLLTAAQALSASRYPAVLKIPEMSWGVQYGGRKLSGVLNGKQISVPANPASPQLLQAALDAWPEVVKDSEIPDVILFSRAQSLVTMGQAVTEETKPTFDKVIAVMEKEPRRRATALVFKGGYYVDYAWEARGGGYADTVTPEGFKMMGERLELASEALNKAFDLNPNDPGAATVMLVVELGQNKGKDVMEQWFARAMKADPDNYKACLQKLYYLEPKWHGSREEMIAFGHECRDSKNWYAKLPMLLPEAHDRLSKYVKNPDAYFRLPGVWADIQSVYVPRLNAWPDDHKARSKYAYYACASGNWAEAKKQFVRLGDKVDFNAAHLGDNDFNAAEDATRFADMKEKAMNGGR
jgi:hypothetical protein